MMMSSGLSCFSMLSAYMSPGEKMRLFTGRVTRRAGKLLLTATLCTVPLGLGQAAAETISNRHHLSPCATQSAPIIIPHADARTVRLGLPAEVGNRGGGIVVFGTRSEPYPGRFVPPQSVGEEERGVVLLRNGNAHPYGC